MKVLVIGGGGREAAIVWKLSQSKLIKKIYAAPGNVGMAHQAELVNIAQTDVEALVDFAQKCQVDLTIVGPEDALALGVVDIFEARGLKIFGPSKEAAIIEYSKEFSKEFMKRNNIPTADFEAFYDKDLAFSYIQGQKLPIVIKADGLAAGKGVYICETLDAAESALNDIMISSKFGESGNSVVVEEFLSGVEVSVLTFVDGKTVVPMISAKDHKQIYDGNKGPNTGGMGTIAPNPVYTAEIAKVCMETIFKPTVAALAKEGRTYKGTIFFGLMLTADGPKVIEYNARFGDPETQVVLPMLDSDLAEICLACCDGTLDKVGVKIKGDTAAACVILASGGYPDTFERGFEIRGLSDVEDADDTIVFFAGVKKDGDKLLTNGGRVLGVTALADSMAEAVEKAYEHADKIDFEKKYMRRDIGRDFAMWQGVNDSDRKVSAAYIPFPS